MQKYHKGDMVKVKYGHVIMSAEKIESKNFKQLGKQRIGYAYDIRPELIEDKATVEYSYNERFGGNSKPIEYSLKFDKNGSIAWFNEDHLIKIK